jgi:MFS family permease
MIPAAARTRFTAGALGIAAAYSMGAIYLALGAQIARDLLRSGNTLVDGALIALSAVAIGAVAIAARRLPARTALLAGPILATVGLGALIAAGSHQSIALFVLSSVVGGAGYALLFSGGLGAVNQSAAPDHRAMVLSAAYVVGYVLQAGTALGLGELTRRADLESALVVGVPVVLAIGYAAALLVRHPSVGARAVANDLHHPVLEGNTP